MRKAELLAPAGSFQVFKAVIAAGADAVYMGLPKFSARAYAENAEAENYLDAIHYAHLHGKKLYCTINTLLKEKELFGELYETVKPLYEAGLDGVIVQDLGEMAFLHHYFPSLPLHASTQATTVLPEAYPYLQQLGIERIVPARELSLTEIRHLYEKTHTELECFIHGALCYCYSGQCLFSSMVGGRSGNRGRCAQPCRMEYQVLDENGKKVNKKDQNYVLSLKDLNTLKDLPKLFDAGIYSLKIEGRMKKAEYAAGVTAIYRKYLDQILSPNFSEKAYKVSAEDEKHLFDLFNRQGFTDGFYHKQNGSDMLTLAAPNFREKDDQFVADIQEKYIQNSHKTKIKGVYSFCIGEPYQLTLSVQLPEKLTSEIYTETRTFFSENGVVAEAASNRAATKEDVEKQLRKLGDTDFVFEELAGTIDDQLFLPVSQLNNFRRQAIESFTEIIKAHYARKDTVPYEENTSGNTENTNVVKNVCGQVTESLTVVVFQPQQLLPALNSNKVDRIILDSGAFDAQEYTHIVELAHASSPKKIYLQFPQVFRERARNCFEEHISEIREAHFDGYVLSDLGALGFAKKHQLTGTYIGNHNLYAFNSLAKETLQSFGLDELICPLELNQYELKEANLVGENLIVYGRAPMMVSASCLHKTFGQCSIQSEKGATRKASDIQTDSKFQTTSVIQAICKNEAKSSWTLIDRMNNELPVVNNCRYCMNMIFNANPTSLLDLEREVANLKPRTRILAFTTETAQETAEIIDKFSKPWSTQENVQNFTHGHFLKGVQ